MKAQFERWIKSRYGIPREDAVAFFSGLVLIIGGAAGALLSFSWTHRFSIYDDAYIYLRYVDRIHAGCPLSYSCGQGPVEGFSSPLYLAMLTLGGIVVPDLELLVELLGTGFLIAAVVIAALTTFSLARRLGAGPVQRLAAGAVTAMTLAGNPSVALHGVVGMETSLAMLLVTLLLRAALTEGTPWLRTLLVLAILARPEAGLFALALPLLPQTRRVRFLAPLLAAGVVMVGLRLLIFHDILPNTFWAKSGGTVGHLRLGWTYLREVVWNVPAVLAAPVFLLVHRPRWALWFLLASGAWFAFFLRSGGDCYSFSRLAMPMIPGLVLLGSTGLVIGAVRAGRLVSEGASRVSLVAVLVVSLVLAVLPLRDQAIPPIQGFYKVLRWKAVGEYLRAEHPGATIATVPVGAMIWVAGAPVIDLVGLTDRTIAKNGSSVSGITRTDIGHERHDTDYVLSLRPDIIVLMRYSLEPWAEEVRPELCSVHAERLLVAELLSGEHGYELYTPEIAPGLYWLMFRKTTAP